jgi:type III restriction enzyme
MLTEGWDANTVTHILGVRAFGTQLLCEQVVGRALRRMSYAAEPRRISTPQGAIDLMAFPVEYAEVYGVPFSFIPAHGAAVDPKPGPIPTHVRALPERATCEITFPRIEGYRYELPAERLEAAFTDDSVKKLSTADIPNRVENAPIVGETSVHTLDELRDKYRPQQVAFHIARRLLQQKFRDGKANDKPWLFPDLLAITKRWMNECLECKPGTFPQLLIFAENCQDAAERIYRAIVQADSGPKRLLPIPKPYDTIGSTRFVAFDTTRPTYRTDPAKCHVSHVVADTESWEQKLAQTLESMPEVVRYVRNDHLGFTIPYTINGQQRNYTPDFIACLDDGQGPDDLLNLIIEVTGEQKKDKEAKIATARTLWAPAVNNAAEWGRWAFVEIRDPWDAEEPIRHSISDAIVAL